MSHNSLSKILKTITIVMILGLAFLVTVIIPIAGKKWAVMADGRDVFLPWAILAWGAVVPCVVALVFFWQICNEISRDNSFCQRNAEKLKGISICAFVDVCYFAVGNLVFLILDMNSPLVFGLSMIVCMIGGAIGIAAAVLARLTTKATIMRQENELTI